MPQKRSEFLRRWHEVLPPDSLIQNPQIIRALFLGAKALGDHSSSAFSAEKRPAMAGKPWTAAEDKSLLEAFDAGESIEQLAITHERSKGGIASRLVRLGRIDERSEIYIREKK